MHEREAPMDIWSLGCAVVEIVSGKWICNHLVVKREVPKIPEYLKCFVRDPKRRWTADMLMNHPFVVLLLKPKRTPTPMVMNLEDILNLLIFTVFILFLFIRFSLVLHSFHPDYLL